MKTIRSYFILFCFLMTALVLVGCDHVNEYVSEAVTINSSNEIHSSAEYKQFEQYRAEGLLNEDNVYPKPVLEEQADPEKNSGAVLVTIASNAYLNCTYYTDEVEKTPLQAREIYLSPGESLYVWEVFVDNEHSNLYDFSSFRIWEYDQEGKRSKEPYSDVQTRSGLILTIPDNYNGGGFSIEPIGSYHSRMINSKTFYASNGREYPLMNGQWSVNGAAFNTSIEISPLISYTVKYDYSDYADSYYFVRSSPTCWYVDKSDCEVIFNEASPDEKGNTYVVELHPYVAMTMTNTCAGKAKNYSLMDDKGKGVILSVKRNGESLFDTGDHGKTSVIKTNLEVGDLLTIQVNSDYKLKGVGVDAGTPSSLSNRAYEYTLYVPDSKAFSIEVSERNSKKEEKYEGYNVANADVVITLNGEPLKIGELLPGDQRKVKLSIIPRAGYYIEGYNNDSNYSYEHKEVEYSKLAKEINSILDKHPAIHFVNLKLPDSDDVGTYTYKLDGKRVEAGSLDKVQVGQKLEVVFRVKRDYSIVHSWFGAEAVSGVVVWTGGMDSITKNIKITPEMDGIAVNYSTFGIGVEKAG